MSGQTASRRATTTAAIVEREVRSLLDSSRAFHVLPEPSQRELAAAMVRIGAYLAAPEGYPANGLSGALTAVAPAAAGQVVQTVDFPRFVAGLIQGVFHAIVDSSIQQMQAYADLVRNVAATVDEFTGAGVSDDDGRDWLATTYPDVVERDPGSRQLRPKPGLDPAAALERLRRLPPEKPLKRLGPDEIEKALLPAARRRLAATRQRVIATMVLMGINRIVVTDGRIRAHLG